MNVPSVPPPNNNCRSPQEPGPAAGPGEGTGEAFEDLVDCFAKLVLDLDVGVGVSIVNRVSGYIYK
ncbi:Hypothetical protein FKW44_015014 [Caligus rogercresseyi]|uniref:Uncharacterized protein n=1 Tax=Caligus rogercresseyi TaxID=217165 RepID=A0A7T8H0B8_CALRO|nr:Hypothetical protein FKW44_015014 [Caligus rogercresseyi]